MSVNRRDFLLFLGTGFTTLAVGSCQNSSKLPKIFPAPEAKFPESLPFKPIQGPLPNSLDFIQAQTSKSAIPVSANSISEQIQAYSTYEVIDDLVLPEGFTYDVIATWGDKVGNSRFGYNNDYVSFIATGEDQGFLTVNFEYISADLWLETYGSVIGKTLPRKKIKSDQNKKINAFELEAKDLLRQDILQLSKEGLTDLGIGVISVQRQGDGRWVRTYSTADRMITGLSGWENKQYLKATGPAVAVFTKKGQGYNDQLGAKIIGTFANCAGGTTPWGTVLSAEENFHSQVTEKEYEYGWLMRLVEDGNIPQAITFRWEMVATGGEVAQGGLGFANPDNLALDAIGNLWMVTDIATNKHNQPVAQGRLDGNQQPLEGTELLGLYGNNSLWFLPTSGEYVGQAFLFATGPMDCELTGPFFTPDQKTLFIAVQHPGEYNGIRKDGATKTLQFALQTTQGE